MRVMDPHEIARRVAAPDEDDLAPVDRRLQIEYALELLDHIPAVERIALSLHLSGVAQEDIAEQLGMVRQSASYRIERGLRRLRFLAHWPGTHLTDRELCEALERHLPYPTVVVLAMLMRTTSVAESSRQLGSTYEFVRYHFRTGLRRLGSLRQRHVELEPYHHVFADLSEHLGVLHEGRVQHRYEGAA